MNKVYTTKELIELSEECGYDKDWMKVGWKPVLPLTHIPKVKKGGTK